MLERRSSCIRIPVVLSTGGYRRPKAFRQATDRSDILPEGRGSSPDLDWRTGQEAAILKGVISPGRRGIVRGTRWRGRRPPDRSGRAICAAISPWETDQTAAGRRSPRGIPQCLLSSREEDVVTGTPIPTKSRREVGAPALNGRRAWRCRREEIPSME